MGWCSATEIFDSVAEFVLEVDAAEELKVGVLKKLIGALEDGDWDCQQDSEYYDDPIVQRIMREFHPRWFEDE